MLDAVRVALEHRIPLAMTDERGCPGWHGQWCRTPDLTRRFIPEIDHFAGTIHDRIVIPGRQAIGLAVARPGESRSCFGNEESEVRIGDNVDPGCRGQVRTTINPAAELSIRRFGVPILGIDEKAVFMAVGDKAAEFVEVPQIGRHLNWFVGPIAVALEWCQGLGLCPAPFGSIELPRQGPPTP